MWTRAGAHNAAAAGVASLEHLNGIADEDIELVKRKGVVAVFTPIPKAVLQQFRTSEVAAAALENIKALKQVSFVMKDGRVVKEPRP
ncbi:MAG TPA: hypothetical protein VE422_18380 [Terriglobia bacterium]|nr:hypothetical protein [Terriglobia bacterium]